MPAPKLILDFGEFNKLCLCSHPMSPCGQKVQLFLGDMGRPSLFRPLASAKGVGGMTTPSISRDSDKRV